MKNKKCERWHRFDNDGVKQIKSFPVGTVQPPTDDNYTPWVKGTGKLSPEHYAIISTAVRKANTGVVKSPETKERMRLAQAGVPKSEEHKHKMSLAKKGKPKTEEHKQNIRIAQLERIRRIKSLI
jgi:hypothetical protein